MEKKNKEQLLRRLGKQRLDAIKKAYDLSESELLFLLRMRLRYNKKSGSLITELVP